MVSIITPTQGTGTWLGPSYAERRGLHLEDLQHLFSLSVPQTSLRCEPIHLLTSVQDSLCLQEGKLLPVCHLVLVDTQRVLGELHWEESRLSNGPTLFLNQRHLMTKLPLQAFIAFNIQMPLS